MLLLAALFFILGVIGLLLPVIPQIPFFAAGCVCLAAGSERFRRWFTNTGFYNRYGKEFIKKHQILSDLIEKR